MKIKAIKFLGALAILFTVALLVGNKSQHAKDIEAKIEQGIENPSRN